VEYVKNNKKSYFTQRLFPLLFQRNLWFLLLLIASFVVYDFGMKKKNFAIDEIRYRMKALEKEKIKAMALQEDLLLHVNSESDPAYMEMVLMKELGVVPEGKMKVHFSSEK
jgi:hypothetical protein